MLKTTTQYNSIKEKIVANFRNKTTLAVTFLLAVFTVEQASAGYYTSPRFLKGLSKAQISKCAGGQRISTDDGDWTYRSSGKKFHRHVWRHRAPEMSIPGGMYHSGAVTPPILRGNLCDVTFEFENGRVSDVDFNTNVRATQAEFTCGIVTDHCLP